MSLLDRYVHAVRKQLPRKERDDIAAELRIILQSQIEAEEAERACRLTDTDVAAILRRYGAPESVAARYGARDHLIGPAVFPHYAFAVRLVLWILIPTVSVWAAVAAFTSDTPVVSVARAVGTGIVILLANLAILTLVFARLERLTDRVERTADWDPRELTAMPELRNAIPRSEAVASLLLMIFWLLWWTDVLPLNRWLLGGSYLAPAPIWTTLTPAIITLVTSCIAIDLAGLARPRWVRLYETAGMVIDVGLLFVLLQALRAPALVMAGDQGPAGGSLTGLNIAISIGLTAWAAVAAIDLVLTARRLVAMARMGGQASVAA